MATKKSTPKRPKEKTTMIKIAEKVGEIAGEISVKKDQIVGIASTAIESVKSTLHNITAPKKTASKKAAKAVVKKAIKPVAKKAKAAVKKVAKKAVKPAVKKIPKAADKKVNSAKKIIKKVVKKVAKKAAGKK